MESGSELSYYLLLANELGLLSKEQYEELNPHTDRIMKMLSALSAKLRGRWQRSLQPKANSQEQKPKVFFP
jgi:hypothetical protein